MTDRSPRIRRLAVVLSATLALTLVPVTGHAEPLVVVPPAVGDVLDGLPEQSRLAEDVHLSAPVAAPIPFSMFGLELPEGADVAFARTSLDGATWSEWEALAYDPHEGPDLDSDEAAGAARGTDPVWVGEARYVQVLVDGGSPEDVTVHVIDGAGLSRSLPGRAADVVRAVLRRSTAPAYATELTRPKVVTRAEWGANESWRNGRNRSAAQVRYGVVHHTATSNDYARADGPRIVNSIYRYHTQSLGWRDIGYNLLVDRYGVIYEGRHGGMTNRIIGAHAGGFNTGSFGVSLIGNFETGAVPTAGFDAMTEAIAWQFAAYDIDPDARITVVSNGSNKYPSGTEVTIPTLIGHSDVGRTACPGKYLYPRLKEMRDQAGLRKVKYPLGVGIGIDFSGPYLDTIGTTHEAAIARIRELGITVGCNGEEHLYCPGKSVLRGQMATFIVNAMRLEGEADESYEDVPGVHVHASSINLLTGLGIASGYRDGTYRPNVAITRAEMAQFLQRALALEPVDADLFTDLDGISRAQRRSINAIAIAGITQGCADGAFCPLDSVTRAQMATFLVRAFDHGDPAAEGDPDEEEAVELVDEAEGEGDGDAASELDA